MKMTRRKSSPLARAFRIFLLMIVAAWLAPLSAQDLAEIRERGVLRHLAVPYGRVVTGNGEGFEAKIVRRFAKHIGVRYEYAQAVWNTVIQDLIGRDLEYKPVIRAVGSRPVRGDIIANGLTILPTREKVVDYSIPTFPSAVCLLALSDSKVRPIAPSGSFAADITATQVKLSQGICL